MVRIWLNFIVIEFAPQKNLILALSNPLYTAQKMPDP